jgi:hypothetical protein
MVPEGHAKDFEPAQKFACTPALTCNAAGGSWNGGFEGSGLR